MSCDNICHGGEGLGIGVEEVGAEGLTDAEEQLGVNRRLVVDALQGTWGDTNAVGEPFVGVALAAKFIADKVTYVYLHRGAICAACYRFLEYHSNDRRQKRKARNLVSQSAVVDYLSKERPDTRLSASICLCFSWSPLMKVPRFRLGRNK